MTQLAQATGAVNLGQGFPDDDAPRSVLAAAHESLDARLNQYPPGPGMPVLRQAISEHVARFNGATRDADTEVVVTMGATEAIAASIMAFVRPGDEVVMFEPYYDSYAAMVEQVGGVRRTIPLRFPDFSVSAEEVRAAFSERTSLLLLNTPHNPTGKIFTREELSMIGEIAAEFDVVVLADEVYEHLAFASPHVPCSCVPNLADRCVTASSAGKTFNVTGWKVGWLTGPRDLVQAVYGVKQWLTFAGAAPLQPAVASALRLPDSHFAQLRDDMTKRRDLLVQGLRSAGFDAVTPEGGYFVLADAAGLGVHDGEEFALRLPNEAGVVAIPASAFCDDASATRMHSVLRFAFCKSTTTIQAGIDALIHTFA